jgi:hypothetical protein
MFWEAPAIEPEIQLKSGESWSAKEEGDYSGEMIVNT